MKAYNTDPGIGPGALIMEQTGVKAFRSPTTHFNIVANGTGGYAAEIAVNSSFIGSPNGVDWTGRLGLQSTQTTATTFSPLRGGCGRFFHIGANSSGVSFIFSTVDYGATWTQQELDITTGYHAALLGTRSFGTSPGTIYVPYVSNSGNTFGGVLVSTDGHTWMNYTSSNAITGTLNWFGVLPDGTAFVQLSNNIYRAPPAAAYNWTLVASPGSMRPAIATRTGAIMYATSSTTIELSTDSGTTWSTETLPASMGTSIYSGLWPVAGYVLYNRVTSDQLYTEDGVNWENYSSIPGNSMEYYAQDDSNVVVWQGGAGVFMDAAFPGGPGPEHFIMPDSGFIESVAAEGAKVLYTFAQPSSWTDNVPYVIGISEDGGATCVNKVVEGTKSTKPGYVLLHGGVGLFVPHNTSYVYRTTDLYNWSKVTLPGAAAANRFNGGLYSELLGKFMLTGYASNIIFTSADGLTWDSIVPGITSGLTLCETTEYLFATGTNSGATTIKYTTDGITWESKAIPGTGTVATLSACGSSLVLQRGVIIWKSTDQGQSWQAAQLPFIPELSTRTYVPTTGRHAYTVFNTYKSWPAGSSGSSAPFWLCVMSFAMSPVNYRACKVLKQVNHVAATPLGWFMLPNSATDSVYLLHT